MDELSSAVCIYKVPRKLRAINEKAYTPQMISIGPFHHIYEPLKDMERQKLIFLAKFCKRTRKEWKDLLQQIEELESKIRQCYDRPFELYDANAFQRKILLDSVFIIEFFLRKNEKLEAKKSDKKMEDKYKEDYILGKLPREKTVLEDLLLLENQVPYFVLERLYKFVNNESATSESDFLELVEKILKDHLEPEFPQDEDDKKFICCDYFLLFCFCGVFICFSGFFVLYFVFLLINRLFFNVCQKEKDDDKEKVDDKKKDDDNGTQKKSGKDTEKKPIHLTDLVRRIQYDPPVSERGPRVKSLYSATKLHKAGVKFEVNKGGRPVNIEFKTSFIKRGVLKMPRFEVHNGTESLIRNVMAFEQCHYPKEPYICEYISILDFLIESEKDVNLLIEKGIITNFLGDSKSVAELVNKLCLEIRVSGSCFHKLSKDLNKYYENPCHNSMAILRSAYFSNIWTETGTIVALILLFFTFIQSVYSLKRIF